VIKSPGETVMFVGKLSDITEKIIGVFYKVYNEMGYGFFEKVYENAMVLELNKLGFRVEQQKPINC
jgi:GxxExxY protein